MTNKKLWAVVAFAGIALAGCSSGGAKADTATTTLQDRVVHAFEARSKVTAATAKGWTAKWCDHTSLGMTKDDLLKVMGKPVNEFPEQASWIAFELNFTAFFNADGTVRQLENNGTTGCATRM